MYDEPNEFKIATGYEKMAIELSTYVDNYTPSGWIEKINVVMNSFRFGKEDAKAFLQMYEEKTLKANLETYDGWYGDLKYKVVHNAIISFFDKNLHLEALEEVDPNEKISDRHILLWAKK